MDDWVALNWFSVNASPKKTNQYFVKGEQRQLAIAVYIHSENHWMIRVNGSYWKISGVHEWAHISNPEE